MDILLMPVFGCAIIGAILFILQAVFSLLPFSWPAHRFPLIVLALWGIAMAYGIYNNPGGYVLILFPGIPLALSSALGLYFGHCFGRFCASNKR